MENVSDVLETRNVINVSQQKLNNVINVSQRPNKISAYGYNIKEVQAIAYRLVDKLDDKESFLFFCKVAWNLPEPKIWSLLEQALSAKVRKSSSAYFTWLCKMEMDGNLS